MDAVLDGAIPVPTNVGFFLVPPPSPNDLAGLAVAEAGDQIGTTAPIVIRPSGDPDGVGVSIDLALPNTLEGQALSITEIDSTFTGLRFPTTCPSTPAQVTVAADSYADATVKSAQAPLPVAGCSSLSYQPKYSLTVARDAGDKIVKVATTVTQGATESPSSSIVLAFPSNVVAPSLSGLSNLCSTGVTSSCTPVGSVTAASPLYPKPLVGKAYLTGQATNITGLTLTLVFPPPFPLTLVGKVDLVNVAATFTGLPDIPLTNLGVTLNGGAERAVREPVCAELRNVDGDAHRPERRQDRLRPGSVHRLRLPRRQRWRVERRQRQRLGRRWGRGQGRQAEARRRDACWTDQPAGRPSRSPPPRASGRRSFAR